MGFPGSPRETCSLAEELTVKARKPYTITKQRERWTDEEHNLFLEALKLYGRAWQRIEEHIGTKTAVQIRSHAQKFFSKLEKEASSKGIPLGQTLDIDIPPPRPKRKPSNPYPRKTCVGTIPSLKERNGKSPSPSTTSACHDKALHLKNCPQLEKMVGVESLERVEDISENGNCSEVLTLFQDAPCVSMSPAKKSYVTPPSFTQFVPFLKDINHKPENEDASTANQKKEPTWCTTDRADMDIHQFKGLDINSQAKEAPMKTSPDHKQSQEVGITSNCELQSARSNVNHVACHPVEANNEKSSHFTNCNPSNMTFVPNQAEVPVYPVPPFNNPSMSARPEHSTHPLLSSFHRELPTFPPFTLFCNNQEAYRSLLNTPFTFSNFIVSSLLQNPTAHAAACLAASVWPSVDGQTINSVPEALFNCGAPTGQVNASPIMAAIASATVAAATAWWATHGLPFCHPLFSTGFSFASTPPTCPTMNNQPPEASEARLDDHAQPQRVQDEHILDPESPDDLVMQRSSSKSLQLTSSGSNESGKGGRTGTELNGPDDKELNLACDCIFHGYGDKSTRGTNIDSCSCGSNKSSSNENETKNVLERDVEDKEKVKQTSVSETNKEKLKRAYFLGSNCRRLRSSGSSSESWKEVSEEGRLAFQALFSMEVLPQTFSSPSVEDGTINLEERIATLPSVKPKSNICEDIVLDQIPGLESSSSRSDNHSDKSVLTSESEYGKLKSNQIGFKPYKRCSMEVKEVRTSVVDEMSNKRSRMEGKSTTR